MVNDYYLLSWKLSHGFFDVLPDRIRFWNDKECDEPARYYDNLKKEHRDFMESLPSTEYGWKLLMGLIEPSNDSLDKEAIRERVDLVELISQFTRLRTSGQASMGKCPFHSERNPSFSVNRKKKVWHCFSCQKSGDVFTFIMLKFNVDFRQALEIASKL